MQKVMYLPFIIACLLTGWLLLAGNTASGAPGAPDHLILTWTDDPATTITVTWRAPAEAAAGVVWYQEGEAITEAARQAIATATSLRTDAGVWRLYSVTLTGLTPNTHYTYRVGDGRQWSATRAFTTADPDAASIKFLVFGDSQSIPPYPQWRKTLRNAYAAHPDARFMVNVGDLVDTGASAGQWHAWFAAGEGVIDTIPVMAALGNHECYPIGTAWRPYWHAQLRLPQNGPDKQKNQVYSLDAGLAHLVVLDSQQGEQRAAGDILTPQRQWLNTELNNTNAPWKFAFLHKGPYHLHGGGNAQIRNTFCPTLEKHNVNVVFSGHDHGVARTHPLKNNARAANGTIYMTTGRGGVKVYRDLKAHPLHAFFYNPLDQPNYLVVEVTGATATITTYKQDDTVIDTFTLERQ
ncbi:MAG: Calcineurin-like phosphoesterase [bacterium ADurb.Bin429]|nr:MAG: Calcineurin-like phosphoesterase [bacterium ADurb.Bin429]